eukprot:5825870-Heterocapsa_arctica.AAC.1
MATWLREVGFLGKIRLRSDGEPAVVAVLKAVAVLRGNDANADPLTIIEETPNKSSASLGCAERFAETLGGVVRTLWQDVEDRQHVKIRANSKAFAWLVSHAVFVYNRFQVRSNGLTPWEDVHARPYKDALFHFGKPVLLRKPTATLQPKMEP